ncbi:Lar family restriction alleviation protein [Pseudomonas nitroreducens]|uniref:Lar family restriction alleviation protein n=1 Tax=Pseudomonas nitroreducens TaxID=46680 RepID=A0ABS0KLU2_PSENT|nr:Lar family restriction alleviation protein [Pseudomonas nitroreducens]MBG6289062.1 Lar family restriction alleviation protein [Pseudomonas nitroreducens]
MDRILIVLREGLGLNFEAMRPALQVGAPIAIGRGGAVIADVLEDLPDVRTQRLQEIRAQLGNEGHGHVVPRLDGTLMRCGGPNNCKICQKEQLLLDIWQAAEEAQPERAHATKPGIFDVITWTAGQPAPRKQELPSLEEHTAQIERVAADLREHGPDLVLLKPCGFCGGPPVPFVQLASQGFGSAPRMDSYGEDGLSVEAFVFCHECGAQGPMFEDDIFDASDYDQAMAEGVRLWQDRDGRHADLYEANAELNLFPRPDSAAGSIALCAGVDVASDRVEVAIHNWTTPAEGGEA